MMAGASSRSQPASSDGANRQVTLPTDPGPRGNDARLAARGKSAARIGPVTGQLLRAAASAVCLNTVVAAPIMDEISLRLAGTINVLPAFARLPNRSR